jgi:hypothetical protein
MENSNLCPSYYTTLEPKPWIYPAWTPLVWTPEAARDRYLQIMRETWERAEMNEFIRYFERLTIRDD